MHIAATHPNMTHDAWSHHARRLHTRQCPPFPGQPNSNAIAAYRQRHVIHGAPDASANCKAAPRLPVPRESSELIGRHLYTAIDQEGGKAIVFYPVGRVDSVVQSENAHAVLDVRLSSWQTAKRTANTSAVHGPQTWLRSCVVRSIIEYRFTRYFEDLRPTCDFVPYTANFDCPDNHGKGKSDGEVEEKEKTTRHQIFVGQIPQFVCICLLRRIVQAHAEISDIYAEQYKSPHHRHIHAKSKNEVSRVCYALNKRVFFDTCGYWYAKNDAAISAMRDFELNRRCLVRPPYALPMSSLVVEQATRSN